MTLQTSGPISLGNLKNEFGGNASPKLSDYYKSGAFNNNTLSTVPTNGTITLSNFYGTSKIQNTIFKSSGADIIYKGVAGDQIIFPNGYIYTVPDGNVLRINDPYAVGIFTIVHSQSSSTYLPSLAGPGLTEIHSITNLPQVIGLSGFDVFPDSSVYLGFVMYGRPNLTKVPSVLPRNITSLTNMFTYSTQFNQDISGWDVTNVTDMSFMFNSAESFNQPLSGWNVANVTTMAYMFNTAVSFNQPIGNWNVGNVTKMAGMFQDAAAFNQYLGDWCVSKITSEPTDFATGTTNLAASNKPRWGTCVRTQNI